MCCPALDTDELDLDGPLPHVTVLRDELPPTFQDDSAGAEEAVEAAEARGEHTLAEKFGERQWGLPGFGPLGPPFGLGREEGPLQRPCWCEPRRSATSSVCTGRPGLSLGCPGPQHPAPFSRLAHGSFRGQRTPSCPVHLSHAGPEAPLHPPLVCLDDSFGPDCSFTCDDCGHGAACLPGLDGCDCPEGWTGLICNESEAAEPGGGGACEPQGRWTAPSSSSSLAPGGGLPGPSIHSLV